MASESRTLYTGVTNNLERRVIEHKRKLVPGFTTRYNVNRLVFYELCSDVLAAISREKQIKGWTRGGRSRKHSPLPWGEGGERSEPGEGLLTYVGPSDPSPLGRGQDPIVVHSASDITDSQGRVRR
jgi:putative endonuclease